MKTLESFIRQKRNELGISQYQLAKRIGVHPQFVSNCERLECQMPVKYFKKISRVFSVDVETLIKKRIQDIESEMYQQIG